MITHKKKVLRIDEDIILLLAKTMMALEKAIKLDIIQETKKVISKKLILRLTILPKILFV